MGICLNLLGLILDWEIFFFISQISAVTGNSGGWQQMTGSWIFRQPSGKLKAVILSSFTVFVKIALFD